MIRRLSPLAVIDRWSVKAQLHARRNAMVASTGLAQRRAEHQEVEDWLASRAALATLPHEPVAEHRHVARA